MAAQDSPRSVAPLTLGVDRFEVAAIFVGESIDLRKLLARLARSPLVLSVHAHAWAVLFPYGAVVMVNLDEAEQARFLAELGERVQGPFADPETEEAAVRVCPEAREGVAAEVIHIREANVERIQVIADALAKSVALAHYEEAVWEALDRVEPMAAELRRKGSSRRRARELLRDIGDALLIHHKIVGQVEAPEKPELLWERPELERLYLQLEDEYELVERHAALERKLQIIGDTAGTLLEVLQTKRSLRVEWYIVLLIVVEILLTLYAMIFQY